MTDFSDKLRRRAKIMVNFREDGVYLAVDNPNPKQPVSRTDITRALAENNVIDADFDSVNKVFLTDEKFIEVKVSNTIAFEVLDEDIELKITPDKMQVHAKFIPPKGGGKRLGMDEIISKMNDIGIHFGISEPLIERLAANKNYNKAYIVAIGKEAVKGTDGYIKYNFDIQESSLKPKMLPDGTADFRNLDLFKNAFKGQLLCSAVDPIEGEDGMNVLGTAIAHVKAKKTPLIPRGKNVTVDPDGRSLHADLDGQIVFANGKLSILPMLEINGDVCNSTGNVDFNGSIHIKGSILTGFRVIASGNIDVDGVIEGAYVQCGGDMNCASGIQGIDKAEISVAGTVTAKYIRNCMLETNGDIVTNAILHSKINCGGKIDVSVGKGLLAGGKYFVQNSVKVKVIGSKMATSTIVDIGVMPELVEQFNSYVSEMEQQKEEYNKINNALEQMVIEARKVPLKPEKKAALSRLLKSKEEIKSNLLELQRKIQETIPKIHNNNGFIEAIDIIHPGVKITIGNATLVVKDEIHHTRLYNEKARIAFGTIVNY